MPNKELPGEGVDLPTDIVSAWPNDQLEAAIASAIDRGEWTGPRPFPLELYVPVEAIRTTILSSIAAMADNAPDSNSDDIEGLALVGMLTTQGEQMLKWLESYPHEQLFMAWFVSPVSEHVAVDAWRPR